jgi:hypothetical protein
LKKLYCVHCKTWNNWTKWNDFVVADSKNEALIESEKLNLKRTEEYGKDSWEIYKIEEIVVHGYTLDLKKTE